MTSILRLDATIKPEGSVSRQLTDRLIDRLTAGGATVTTRDLAAGIPPVDPAWLGAVFTPAEARDADQTRIAAESEAILAELLAADIVVIGLPIYNFGVPATLKTWFDHIARKGITFRYSEAGPEGLLKGKRAYVVMSSDGTRFGSDFDFASGYVRHMLTFLGFESVEFITADAMVFDPVGTIAKAEAAVDALAA
ncbi:FMN-dependent NADH-azoreductase [Frigidibacter oleivorans]|uniref:FMN-dependent NADH-azoreductase n=1 Tax=Frigidibacter oleivorans TaxID=2487129 RepID=UPI000F8E7209|nr:NAD(P)H-dependent oxidoreductase [Frigidibacter oleivorans]